MVVTAGEEDALRHLISRQTTEWNASSSYIVMAAHATGHLHNLIRNLERDEVKHLCIMSAAAAYLLGPRPWGRFLDLVRKGLDNYTSQKKSRSGGRVFGTNPVTAIEGIVAHSAHRVLPTQMAEDRPAAHLNGRLRDAIERPGIRPRPGAFAPETG